MNAGDTPGTRRRSTNVIRIRGGIAEMNGKSGEEREKVSKGCSISLIKSESVSTRDGGRASICGFRTRQHLPLHISGHYDTIARGIAHFPEA